MRLGRRLRRERCTRIGLISVFVREWARRDGKETGSSDASHSHNGSLGLHYENEIEGGIIGHSTDIDTSFNPCRALFAKTIMDTRNSKQWSRAQRHHTSLGDLLAVCKRRASHSYIENINPLLCRDITSSGYRVSARQSCQTRPACDRSAWYRQSGS